MNRYQLFTLFILFSIVMFFIARWLGGLIYSEVVTYDIIGQFTNAIDIAVKIIGAYLMFLCLTAVLGLSISKVKRNPEYIKGFKFSLIFCLILLAFYLIFYCYLSI